MLLKRTLTTLAVCFLLPGLAESQQQSAGSLTVNSAPAGADIRLEGESNVTGITPAVFRFPLSGKYRLTVTHRGYESYKTVLVLDPRKETVINIDLVPKSRIKAAVRSLFIPGWGQYYSGQQTKGLVFTLLASASVVGYFLADDNFDDKFSRLNQTLDDFDRAEQSGANFDELSSIQQQLSVEHNDAFDAENVRRFSIGTVAGIWGLSVLDALLFFPEERGTVVIKGIALSPDYGIDRVGFTLSRKF